MRVASALAVVLCAPAIALAGRVTPEKAAFALAAAQEGTLEFDNGDHHYIIVPYVPGQFMPKSATNSTDTGATARSVVDVLLNRRQTCSAGYGYCSSFGRCCPDTDRCCSYGYCLEPNQVCCTSGPCSAGTNCCGVAHCYPVGGDCCRDESKCDPGNQCYIVAGHNGPVCCTDESCTAYVTGGVTITRTASMSRTFTTPPPATTTIDEWDTYYFTYTWWYFVYYWYTIDVTESVVTSTRTVRTTYYTVTASDANDATASFSSLTSNYAPTPPASATSLRSLAGATATQPLQTFGDGQTQARHTSTTATGHHSTSTSLTSDGQRVAVSLGALSLSFILLLAFI